MANDPEGIGTDIAHRNLPYNPQNIPCPVSKPMPGGAPSAPAGGGDFGSNMGTSSTPKVNPLPGGPVLGKPKPQ